MHKKIVVFFLVISIKTFSQSNINGKIIDEFKQPIFGASVVLKNTILGTVTNKNGFFELKNIPKGTQTIEMSFVGYKTRSKTITVTKNKSIFIEAILFEDTQNIDEVIIKGKSKQQKKRESPIKIEVIDVKQLQAQSISLPQVINQTAGVNIRQQGGVGSETTININGLQGNAIRFFRDGIPLDYLGRGFNLSILPVDQLANIEVYKGVLPVSLGADALGGAINFVSKNTSKNSLDISYSFGSFNSHLANLNGYFNIPESKLFVSLASYTNISDNNYKIEVEIPNKNTGNPQKNTVERFHDGVESFFTEAKLGVKSTKWADVFEIGYAHFDFNKELQNNIRLTSAYGEAENKESSNIFSTRYTKKINGLSFDVFGAYSQRKTLFNDTPKNRYDWLGEATPLEKNDNGGEVDITTKAHRNLTFKNYTARLKVTYKLNKKHQLNFNHNYIYQKRTGTDPFGEKADDNIDILSFPATYTRNISGIGLNSTFFDKKIENIILVKRFGIRTSSISVGYSYNGTLPELSDASFGYGNSIKYNISQNRYLRLSYEKTTRIPESWEYFGDGVFIIGNSDLKPEISNNVNVGFYSNLDKNNNFSIDINTFYRHVKNNIFLRPFGVLSSRYENTDNAKIKGAELTVKGSPIKHIKFNFAVTYQDIRIKSKDIRFALINNARQPNIPYFFSNLGIDYQPETFLRMHNWQFYTHYYFVEKYLLDAVEKSKEPPLFGSTNNKSVIATQHLVDLGITYKLSKQPLWLNLQVNNVLNTKAYDGFRVQKPNTNFRFKIKYSIN